MRYMLMMHAPRGTGDWQVFDWKPEDLKAHIAFMHELNNELTDAGELVGAEGLAPPGEARVVRAGSNGAPAVTDGPFAEAKEFLAGRGGHGAWAGRGPRAHCRTRRRPAHRRPLPAVRCAAISSSASEDIERAIAHYHAAADRTASVPERDYLRMKAARLAERALGARPQSG